MNSMRSGWARIVLATLAMSASLQACAESGARLTVTRSDNARAALTAAPMKMNGSGITMQYRIDTTPQAGRATPVVLKFNGVTDSVGASVRLSADSGLTLEGAETPRALPAGEITTWTVTVVPAADGIRYLHVLTTQNGATSATSIAIQVGKAPANLPSSSELKQSPSGEKILSMPVK